MSGDLYGGIEVDQMVASFVQSDRLGADQAGRIEFRVRAVEYFDRHCLVAIESH